MNIKAINSWYDGINSMFGDVVCANAGGFDADVSETPPFVNQIPPANIEDCFTFKEIATSVCGSEEECVIKLIDNIEAYIDSDMSTPKDRSKATIVWRIRPEIVKDKAEERFYGYTRVKVLDRKSTTTSYFKP